MDMIGTRWKELVIFAGVFAGVSVALLIARGVSFGLLDRWAKRTLTAIDDVLAQSLRQPSFFWVFAVALYVALGTSGFPQRYVDYGLKALYVLIVLSVTVAVANFVAAVVERSMEKSAAGVPVTGLSRAIIKVFVYLTGALVIIGGLGISITPLITALGVGGLAVALALQDTLSNLFAGVHILVERPFAVGDYIKLDGGEEGYVADIGWRNTRIRKLQNNIVIVPNNKLSQSVITNFYLPEKRMSFSMPVLAGYGSDPEAVERILLEEASGAAAEIRGLLSDPLPSVMLSPGFGEFSLAFTLVCHIEEFADQYPVQHELRKRIFKRFKKEGIEMPFTAGAVYVKKG